MHSGSQFCFLSPHTQQVLRAELLNEGEYCKAPSTSLTSSPDISILSHSSLLFLNMPGKLPPPDFCPGCSSTWASPSACLAPFRKGLVAQMVKNLPAMWVQSLGWEDSPGEGNGDPLQYSCLENPIDRGAWQATVHGVAKSGTHLRMHAMLPHKN